MSTQDLNDRTPYVMFSVFRLAAPLPREAADRTALVTGALEALAGVDGLTTRGWYDVAGFRADADLLVWWWAEEVAPVQEAYRQFRASDLGALFEPVWSQVGTHRPAEFNKSHVPALLTGAEPKGNICVYPFVRSYEWYGLDPAERNAILREHGSTARVHTEVQSNTFSSFALGDYEWLLAFEADNVGVIVDLMRDLRGTRARLHVREEIPFFTGPRHELAEIIESLPRA